MKPVLFLGSLIFVASFAHADVQADTAAAPSSIEQSLQNNNVDLQNADEIRGGFGGGGGFNGGPRGPIRGPVGGGFGGPRPGFGGGGFNGPRPGFGGGFNGPRPGYYPGRPGFGYPGYYPQVGWPGAYPIPVPVPYGPVQAGGQITCASQPGLINACGIGWPISYAQVVEQYSPVQCVNGYTFGISPDRMSLWVAGGCQATFIIN